MSRSKRTRLTDEELRSVVEDSPHPLMVLTRDGLLHGSSQSLDDVLGHAVGDETTWRFTGALRMPASGTRLHGTIGTAFRAPDFNELYFPFAGDPELRPEINQGLDIGVEQSLLGGRLVFDVTWFENADTAYKAALGWLK